MVAWDKNYIKTGEGLTMVIEIVLGFIGGIFKTAEKLKEKLYTL